MPVRFADLVLESEIDLPTLPRSAEGPECCFRLDPPGPPRHDAQRWDHHWRSSGGAVCLSCAKDGSDYRLGVPGLATFAVRDLGREIVCRPESRLPDETIEHLLVDQILPRVLTLRGRLILHAGCVVVPQGAIAFLGDSGAGKSTLCAAFARAGYGLLGDDGILVRPVPSGGFETIATYPGLRLFPAPLEYLFGEVAATSSVAHTTVKRRLDPRHPALSPFVDAAPLVLVYTLETGGNAPRRDPTAISAAAAREAFVALVKASFQLHLDDPVRARTTFTRFGELVDAVPVRRLAYPRDLARLPELVEAVVSDARVSSLANSGAAARS